MSLSVTWLMPVKNGMPYLPTTLASIQAQTFRDWQLLVWDNGSTDGTLEELRRWIPAILPGRIISSEPLSLGNSLARLVETADTELCARIDADDVNHPERLARQVSYMQAHPEVGLLGSQIEFIDRDGRVVEGAWWQDLTDAEVRWRIRWQGSVTHSTAMFRRSAVLAAGNYTDTMPYEDHDLWLRMAQLTEVANLPDVLVQYRLSPTSVTGLHDRGYDQLADRAAQRNAAILFPGFEPRAAVELRLKAKGHLRDQLRWSDVCNLWKAARRTAVAFGKPKKYFTSTENYRRQRLTLITRQRFGSTFLKCEEKLLNLHARFFPQTGAATSAARLTEAR